MAGTDPTPVAEVELIDVAALMHKFEDQRKLLVAILDTLKFANRARAIVKLHAESALTTNAYTSHTKLFVEYLMIAATTIGAGVTFTLNIGSIAHRFRLSGASPTIIPFPIVIDRGIDLSGTFGASQTEADIYLIGTVE